MGAVVMQRDGEPVLDELMAADRDIAGGQRRGVHRVVGHRPGPDITDGDVAARLATPGLRFSAHMGLLFHDHQFIRVAFQNAHQIDGDMWRSNQPSPAQLKRWADRGIKTVLNLRGRSIKSWHVLERDACAKLGMDLVSFRIFSREAPWTSVPRDVRDMLNSIRYPALLHCKSGADRAGVMAVFYRHFRQGVPIREAVEQLSAKYLHVAAGKTGILDAYFAEYLASGAPRGLDIITWSENFFDPVAFKQAYQAGTVGSFVTDTLLRRE